MRSAARGSMSVVVASIVLASAPTLGLAPKASALKGLRTSSARVLIFAPHPDDGVLGAAGLIRRVLEGGGSVRVVFMTSGDGFPAGVTRETHSPHPSADDYRWYAQQREAEAVRSLGTLGVGRDQIVFLGFPDQGLCPIRRLYRIDRPPYYRSPFTAADRPPPAEVLIRDTEYDVADLEHELRRLMMHFRPMLILVPHWADTHPDHCTTFFFVEDALRDVEGELPGFHADLVAYLIHFGGWPEGNTSALAPPHDFLASAKWVKFPLTPREAALKRDALAQYRTQMDVMEGYLLSFARSNELFVLDPERLPADAERRCCEPPTSPEGGWIMTSQPAGASECVCLARRVPGRGDGGHDRVNHPGDPERVWPLLAHASRSRPPIRASVTGPISADMSELARDLSVRFGTSGP